MTNFRRAFISIIMAIIIIPSFNTISADNVDSLRASKAGAYFLASQFGNKSLTADRLVKVYEIENAELGIPAAYIFNTDDKRGFVVVAGNDCVSPIMAYSTDGALDPQNIPPAMLWFLNDQAGLIRYAQQHELNAVESVSNEWRQLEEQTLPYFGTESKAITRLLKSIWNQEPVFNNMCPVIHDSLSVAGCVATAMAQVIYYWRYPRVGYSSQSYDQSGYGPIYVNFAQAYYNYDLMFDTLTSNVTQAQKDAVALLNYHCGVSVYMDYSPSGSSAQSSKVPTALRKFFKYDKDSLRTIDRTSARFANETGTLNAKDTLWVQELKTEILKKRPIYYSGHDYSSTGVHAGHAFVCDGYNSMNGLLHFNWGWGGSGDCWCNVYRSQLQPQGSSYKFTSSHFAILGVQPPNDSIQTVGIPEVANPFTMAAYPNPANDQVTVSYDLGGNGNATMQVYDITGKMVDEITLYAAATQVTLNVADYRPGVYMCRLNGHSVKFVKR